jgi:hypothetical protein
MAMIFSAETVVQRIDGAIRARLLAKRDFLVKIGNFSKTHIDILGVFR